MMSWPSLPAELRWIVFQYLGTDKCRQYQSPDEHLAQRLRTTGSTRGEQSQYAAVNREWQAYFEAQNFNRLILGHSDVCQFDAFVSKKPHRSGLVRWIWLRVELPVYGCDRCSEPESKGERTANQNRFTLAILNMLEALSELDTDSHPGITLELSVHSPSDSEHYCQELKNTLNDTAWHVSKKEAYEEPPDDPAHGWVSGRRRPLGWRANLRVFGEPNGLGVDMESTHLSPSKTLPKARVVTELVIRLQFLRHFSVRRALVPIIQCLPRMRTFNYECRQGINMGPVSGQTFRQREHRILLDYVLPRCKALRKISMYEANNRSYCPTPSPRASDPTAGQYLAARSHHLKEIYASWIVDARDFFHNFWPDAKVEAKLTRAEWLHLKYLSLTTNFFSTGHCESLLQAAGTAAERMPVLKIMDIRGHYEGERFLYLRQDRQHSIFFGRGLANMISPATVLCWQRVAAARGSLHELKVNDWEEYKKEKGTRPPSVASRAMTHTTSEQLRTKHRWLAGDD